MAVTPTPIFAQAPKHAVAQIVTANTTLDGPTSTTALTVFTAGVNGSKVFSIEVQAYQAATAAGIVRIFIGGTSGTGRLYDEFLVVAQTGSSTAAMFRLPRSYPNLVLSAGELLIAATSITQNINVHAFYGDF